MSFDPLSAALDLGTSLVDKFFSSPVEKAAEKRKLEELYAKGDLAELNAYVQILQGQMAVNMQEAKHKSIFVAGWRPFVGWVGGASLLYAGLLHPLLSWLWKLLEAFGYVPAGVEPPPYIESGLLGTIITGMLGIGSMRSFEKRAGVQTDSIRKRK